MTIPRFSGLGIVFLCFSPSFVYSLSRILTINEGVLDVCLVLMSVSSGALMSVVVTCQCKKEITLV